MFLSFPGRVDDEDSGYESDCWFTRSDVPLRASRWFRSDAEHGGTQRSTQANISCNIWERAKVRRNITHRLISGARHRNIGYEAVLWYEILFGEVRGLGTYPFAQILPDKIARFLFEFHHKEFRSMELPDLPDNRGQLDVHRMLNIRQVRAHMKRGTCKIL